jgi:hypothetical protein
MKKYSIFAIPSLVELFDLLTGASVIIGVVSALGKEIAQQCGVAVNNDSREFNFVDLITFRTKNLLQS